MCFSFKLCNHRKVKANTFMKYPREYETGDLINFKKHLIQSELLLTSKFSLLSDHTFTILKCNFFCTKMGEKVVYNQSHFWLEKKNLPISGFKPHHINDWQRFSIKYVQRKKVFLTPVLYVTEFLIIIESGLKVSQLPS